MIRTFEARDYDEVVALLKEYQWKHIPELDELKQVSLVFEIAERVVGFVWALCDGKSAYIDYLVVDKAFRGSAEMDGRSVVPVALMNVMLMRLRSLGVTRVYGALADNYLADSLTRTFTAVGMEAYPMKYAVVGDLKLIIKKMAEMRNG